MGTGMGALGMGRGRLRRELNESRAEYSRVEGARNGKQSRAEDM
jgi:hypothetical protein